MTAQRSATCALIFFLSFTSSLAAQGDQQRRLHEDDEKLLRSMKEFIFVPPTDAVRVRVRIKAPGWRENDDELVREGWLVREKTGDRVYFTDGESAPTPASEKFEKIVRTRLTTLPPGLTVGGFLGTTDPGSAPPVSFFEFYIGRIDLAARQIVPS